MTTGLLPETGSGSLIARHAQAQRLDARLGDATAPGNPFGFAAAVTRDEREAFPEELAAALRAEGLHLSYLPAALGGRLDGFDRTMSLVRVAARRDLNAMPATMLSISAVTSVLVHGSEEQQRRVAGLVGAGRVVGFALSEEQTGSDVLANTCRLDDAGTGFVLSGDKWLVGLGGRCDALYVVARTGDRGPAAFSAVLLELDSLPAACVRVGAPATTAGMRGIDFAPYGFDACPVPAEALVGARGQGLEAAMKAQQVVRMMSAAGNLACADTALRVVLDFALERSVGRARLIDLPHARRELGAAFAELAVCDVVALAAARAAHVAPERFGLWSCVVKRVATELTDDLIARCGSVLGARSVVHDGPTAIFEKMQRDNTIVRVIDTSPVGNLRAVAMHLPPAASARAAAADDGTRARLARIFTFDSEVPELAPAAFQVGGRGDDVTRGLSDTLREAKPALDERTIAILEDLESALEALHADVRELKDVHGTAIASSVELLDLAERFCELHAAAACVHAWWFNRGHPLFGEEAGSTTWLRACVAVTLARAEGRNPRTAGGLDGAFDTALRLHRDGCLFSSVPLRLARSERG